jgi:hypothetical protein
VGKTAFLLVAAVVAAACRVGPDLEPQPLVGPSPGTIAVWPVVEGASPALRDELLQGLEQCVRNRGYRTVSPGVAAQLLAGRAEGAAARAADVGADAIVRLVVRDFDAEGRRPLVHARWDLEWRLEDAAGALLWSHTHHGTHSSQPVDRGDPHRRFDDVPDIVPVGGDRSPRFGTAGELMHWLHRDAMQHLPRQVVRREGA